MSRKDFCALIVIAAALVAMMFVPSAEIVAYDTGRTFRARVVAVDDTNLSVVGSLEYGTEKLEVELLDGPLKGSRMRAENELRAQPDVDKKFKIGDIAIVNWPQSEIKDTTILKARDHWRIGWFFVMAGAFALLLILFAGITGVKAVLSFMFSCFAVWKMLVPLCLKGWSASLVSFATVCVLTFVIMYLVAGATKKGVVAFAGSMLGIASSLVLAHFFSSVMHINGMTMPFVQALINSGYSSIDASDVFIGAIILGSSGAVMDLAMDIASGVCEVKYHNSSLGFKELFLSGLRMGRAVVGTMTTTLLLAYSGGYLTLLMVFAAQGTDPLVFLNSTIVSAETVKTFVGSFGLVLVAPFTAFIGALIYSRSSRGHADDAV